MARESTDRVKTGDARLSSEIKKAPLAPQVVYVVVALDPEVRHAYLSDGRTIVFKDGEAIVPREDLEHFSDERRFRCVSKEILPEPSMPPAGDTGQQAEK